MTDLDARKRALRAQCKTRPPRGPAASLAAQQRLLGSGLLDAARCVALYDALPSEVQTAQLEQELTARGVRVLMPRVVPGQRPLTFHDAAHERVPGPLGVRQPQAHHPDVPLADIDVFVLSGLAADPAGGRLGRGKGHYDATVSLAPRALRVLLVFDDALVPEVPVGEHDAPMDAVCTDLRLLRCTARAR